MRNCNYWPYRSFRKNTMIKVTEECLQQGQTFVFLQVSKSHNECVLSQSGTNFSGSYPEISLAHKMYLWSNP